ncbi:MAG: helix-turn-helix transcriptional regulator [Desulfobulbaceae bacterium]|nr:helix-turn-helix transcriptional regulator [Desulfobulbaceae bacterium]
MDSAEFIQARTTLGKTQKQIAELLGLSIKAIHSYEQEWRTIPSHVERQIFFLLSRTRSSDKKLKPCWTVKKCPKKRRDQCPAWEFQAGKMCWFINGTICGCNAMKNWEEKMEICRRCEVLVDLL